VVVTGLGVITPVGNDVPSAWSALLTGKSGAGPITQFDVTDFRTKIAASVKDFDPTAYIDKKDARRMDRYVHFAVAATRQALADARFDMSQWDPSRVGVYIGSGIGGLGVLLDQADVLRERGVRRVSPFTVPGLMLNSASAHVSIISGAQGPNLAMATACATGSHVLGEAGHIIRRGDADAMIVGGSEAAILGMTMAGFDNMGALSCRNEDPARASRPFDAERDGFVMGEGAGMLILERMDLAVARGAHIYGELIGYALNGDAHHITAPADDGQGASKCMRMALESAGITPRNVDYINAHGTSTPLNDAVETRAIKAAFGDDAYRVAISSTKSMTGHLMGAAGAMEAVFCMLAMRDQVLPPTINYETPDPFCDLDYVPNVARSARVDVVMSNSFGFGGHNSTVIFQRVV
jgi:3-oxoacyl-[acyl-carrier-protein] synthase II